MRSNLSMVLLRWSGRSGDITPSMASLPSPPIHGRSFGRFDEILYLVEKYTRPHPRSARRVRRARGVTLTRLPHLGRGRPSLRAPPPLPLFPRIPPPHYPPPLRP